jgi:hypothetical protein
MIFRVMLRPRPAARSRRLGGQAGDAERVKGQLKLARDAVVADGLKEQVQDAEAFGNEERSQTGAKRATARWTWAADTVSRWAAASSSRSSTMRCSS